MKKIFTVLAVAGLATFSTLAQANAEKPVALWLCSDFLTVNETFQPTALGFAAAVNHNGKIEEAVLNVDGIAKVQPEIVKYCNENPEIKLRDALAQHGSSATK